MTHHKKVIPFVKSHGDDREWIFYDFFQSGTNFVERWREDLSEEARFHFDAILKDASKTAKFQDWVAFRKFLKGKAADERIWELEFRADRRQYRVLGQFRGERVAVLFAGCYHKQNVYAPKDAIETARKRARSLSRKEATLVERKIRLDI